MLDHHLIESVKLHEGFRTKAYQDTEGVWTVGYGHNLESHGVPAKYAQYVVVSEMDAERLLREDLEDAYRDAMSFSEFEYLDTKARRNVFIEMTFNLGRSRLSGFRRMLGAIKRQDWELAKYEMLDSRWRLQVGQRALRLADLLVEGYYHD